MVLSLHAHGYQCVYLSLEIFAGHLSCDSSILIICLFIVGRLCVLVKKQARDSEDGSMVKSSNIALVEDPSRFPALTSGGS